MLCLPSYAKIWVEGVWPNDGGGSEKLRVETQLLVPFRKPARYLAKV